MKQYCSRTLKHGSWKESEVFKRRLGVCYVNKSTFYKIQDEIKCLVTHLDENVGVSNNYEKGFGTSDGDIEAFGVGQKAEHILQIIAIQ